MIIKIYDAIDPYWGYSLADLENDLRLADGQDVHVKIQSGGGSVFEGLAIYNTLKNYEGNVTTEIVGISASIASIIFLAGSKRIVNEVGFLMIHEAWTMTAGNANDLREDADLLDQINAQILDIYEKVTGFNREELKAKMSKDTYMGPKELLELGFVTEVSEGMKIAASIGNHISVKNFPQTAKGEHMAKDDKAPEAENQKFAELETKLLALQKENDALKTELENKSDEKVEAKIQEGIRAEKERETAIMALALNSKQKAVAEKLVAEGSTIENAVMAINKDFQANYAEYTKVDQGQAVAMLQGEAPSASGQQPEEQPQVDHVTNWRNIVNIQEKQEYFNKYKTEIKGAL